MRPFIPYLNRSRKKYPMRIMHYLDGECTVPINEQSVVFSMFTSNTTPYTGEALVYLEPIENLFHAILAVDTTKRVIPTSNSFLTDNNFVRNSKHGVIEYDSNHSIMSRIEKTYRYLQLATPAVVIEQPVFMLVNAFSATNFGHDLSILFDRIAYYRSLRLNIPVVVGEIMNSIPRSLEICQLLLPDTEFYYLKNNTPTLFKNIIIPHNTQFYIEKNHQLINEVITKCNATSIDEKYMNRKIFIVKNNSNKNIVTKSTVFQCIHTMELLTNQYNYVCINPEAMHMTEIVKYLSNASKIITSHGAISYGNAIFFNKNANIYYLNADAYYDNHISKTVYVSQNIDSDVQTFLKTINEI
jgi:hypothetical protein